MSDLLFTAGTLLFVAWTLIVGALSAAAFARDLLPARTTTDRRRETQPRTFPAAGSS